MNFTGRLIQFGNQYQKQITWGIGSLVILISIILGGRYIAQNNEKKALELYRNAVARYEAAKADTSAADAYVAVKGDFDLILAQYGGKKAGKLAGIVYGDISYKAKDTDTAISMYDAALKDISSASPFRNMILNGLGYAYEMKGDFENAARYFEMISSGNASVLKSGALFNLARIYKLSGDEQKSLDHYRKLLSDYPESSYSGIAKEKAEG